MSIETQKNRDLFLKLCFMYFLNNVLTVLGIDEEIEDILPTELITMIEPPHPIEDEDS